MQPVSSNGAPISPSDPSQVEIGEGRIEEKEGDEYRVASGPTRTLHAWTSSHQADGLFRVPEFSEEAPPASLTCRKSGTAALLIHRDPHLRTDGLAKVARHARIETFTTLIFVVHNDEDLVRTLVHTGSATRAILDFELNSYHLPIFFALPTAFSSLEGRPLERPENPCPPNETRHSHYSIIRPTQKPLRGRLACSALPWRRR